MYTLLNEWLQLKNGQQHFNSSIDPVIFALSRSAEKEWNCEYIVYTTDIVVVQCNGLIYGQTLLYIAAIVIF